MEVLKTYWGFYNIEGDYWYKIYGLTLTFCDLDEAIRECPHGYSVLEYMD